MLFLSAVRTPFGAFGGALRDLTATDLAVHASRAAIERAGISADTIDAAFFGNVLQTSGDACYYARHVALRAGCRIDAPALTLNRLCGSGFEAVVQGAAAIRNGEAEICLVGGGESMSQAPFVARGIRWGVGLGANPPLIDSLTEALRDAYAGCAMAETAENLAERYGLTREIVDAYALRSQHLARDAWANGTYDAEVVAVPVQRSRSKPPESFARDEHMRPDSTAEEAGSKMATVMKDVIFAAAGLTPFAAESAKDLVNYMVRRGQMGAEEAERINREIEAASEKRGGSKPVAKPAGKEEPKAPSPFARPAMSAGSPPPAFVPQVQPRVVTPAATPAPAAAAPAPAPAAVKKAAAPAAKAEVKKPAPAAKVAVKKAPAAKKAPAKKK